MKSTRIIRGKANSSRCRNRSEQAIYVFTYTTRHNRSTSTTIHRPMSRSRAASARCRGFARPCSHSCNVRVDTLSFSAASLCDRLCRSRHLYNRSPNLTAWLPAPIAPDVFCSSFKHQFAKVVTISIIYVIHIDHCAGAIPRRRKGGGDCGIQFGCNIRDPRIW
jgi:hypothetical protein